MFVITDSSSLLVFPASGIFPFRRVTPVLVQYWKPDTAGFRLILKMLLFRKINKKNAPAPLWDKSDHSPAVPPKLQLFCQLPLSPHTGRLPAAICSHSFTKSLRICAPLVTGGVPVMFSCPHESIPRNGSAAIPPPATL